MKSAVILILATAVAFAAAISGYAYPYIVWPSVVSLNPLYRNEADLTFDPLILGTWGAHMASFTFEKADTLTYDLTVTHYIRAGGVFEKEVIYKKAAEEKYKVYLVKFNGKLFLDMFRSYLWTGGSISHKQVRQLHSFMEIKRIGSRLQLRPVRGTTMKKPPGLNKKIKWSILNIRLPDLSSSGKSREYLRLESSSGLM